jgi:hypothetical protein
VKTLVERHGGPTSIWTAPTREQDLLLQASLLRGPDAIEAWHAWRADTRIDALDSDSQWLLPLLYSNLHAHGIPADRLVRYRNVYLHNWYKNSLTLRRAEAALRQLQRDSHSVVLLGGSALALRHYDALGARPFERISVLARRRSEPNGTSTSVADDVLDVQTSLFDADLDESLAQQADEGEWKTLRWRVLDPPGQLVDICVRRHTWDRRSTLFWLADAVTVIRRHHGMDWRRVGALAARLGQRSAVAAALDSVEERFALGIPSALTCGFASESTNIIQ